jgi:valyl-tRNA synthetase
MLLHPPAQAPGPFDEEAERELDLVREDVTRARGVRAERGLSPRSPLLLRLPAGRSPAATAATRALAGPATLGPEAEGAFAEAAPADADPAAERERLAGELRTAEAEAGRARGKLGNARFVERAPADLVDAEREKLARWEAEAERLRAALGEGTAG